MNNLPFETLKPDQPLPDIGVIAALCTECQWERARMLFLDNRFPRETLIRYFTELGYFGAQRELIADFLQAKIDLFVFLERMHQPVPESTLAEQRQQELTGRSML